MTKQNKYIKFLLNENSPKLKRVITNAVLIISSVAGIITIWLLGSSVAGRNTEVIDILLKFDTLLLLIIIVIFIYRVAKIFFKNRKKRQSSGLQRKMTSLFIVLTLVPAIIVAVFSLLLFELGLSSWFSNKVAQALTESRQITIAYLNEYRNNIVGDALLIARELDANASKNFEIQKVLSQQGKLKKLNDAIVFDGRGVAIAKYGSQSNFEAKTITAKNIQSAKHGNVVILSKSNSRHLKALVKLNTFLDLYLLIGRIVDPKVLGNIKNTESAIDEYDNLKKRRSDLELTFILTYILVILLLLIIAVWIGLKISLTLTSPLGKLIDATTKIAKGKYQIKLDESGAHGEFGQLMLAFNKMAQDLDNSSKKLSNVYMQLDERAHFIEALLESLRTGIIALDENKKVVFANKIAYDLFEIKNKSLRSKKLHKIVDEFADSIEQARSSRSSIENEIDLTLNGVEKSLYARIILQIRGAKIYGYILSFDDIGELKVAQKNLAWADVAKRIAHEIKNPLTPIQLSAERLKRKYSGKFSSDDVEVFDVCTDTIIRQVGEIGRLVDEFNSFARMPKPVLRTSNIVESIRKALTLQRTAHDFIEYTMTSDNSILCKHDQHQIGQLITNLLKNSYVSLVSNKTKQPKISISIAQVKQLIIINVDDNGVGFPKQNRETLLTPYVSHNKGGSGLGLSIAEKIVDDHHGVIELNNSKLGGANVKITLPFQNI